ncbi:MAG TPA: glycosyltransferase family 2 protein [Candidatus Marinimicrobia bacterium]|nr:glycosyltransferase family 2 protein [Candidatus Neomarinimicrobiota bacterium]
MLNAPKFNYIITIHNKEDLIEEVLKCVLMCCRDNSHVYPVLDGCTDNTEKIVDGIINRSSGVPITKVYTPDVHELLSINAGLKAAFQEGEGFNIILQDDVLLLDTTLEDKVHRLYQWAGPKLGYVSFRMGANFTKDSAKSQNPVPYTDYVENAYGHGIRNAKMLPLGHLAYRTVPIKSPVCLPFKIVREVGMFNEKLAPYGHDDPELAIRIIKAGYHNAVFSLKFESDVDWGGTRTTAHPNLNPIIERNMNYIRNRYSEELTDICLNLQPFEIVKVDGMATPAEEKESKKEWHSKVKPRRFYLFKSLCVKFVNSFTKKRC